MHMKVANAMIMVECNRRAQAVQEAEVHRKPNIVQPRRELGLLRPLVPCVDSVELGAPSNVVADERKNHEHQLANIVLRAHVLSVANVHLPLLHACLLRRDGLNTVLSSPFADDPMK